LRRSASCSRSLAARAFLDGVLDHRRLLAHPLAHHGPLESEGGLERERAEHAQVRLRAFLGGGEEDAQGVVARSAERSGNDVR
jgi:hypothetical protein